MTTYVVGFAFDQLQKVWLIHKGKPEWQKGKFNGPGGAVRSDESPIQAMTRKFHEEAGLLVPTNRWIPFSHETWDSKDSCYFFTTRLQPGEKPVPMTDEPLVGISWIVLSYSEWTLMLPDLVYLVPMAYTNLLNHQP